MVIFCRLRIRGSTEEINNMKNKQKIGIGLTALALSIVSAFASGTIPIDKLFADAPTPYANGVTFQPGDMVMIGGKQFTVLDTSGKLLAYDNIGDATNYDYPADPDSGDSERTEVAERLGKWATEIMGTGDSTYLQNAGKIIKATEAVGIDNVGNGSNFWTDTDGNIANTKQIIGADGTTIIKNKWASPAVKGSTDCEAIGTTSNDGQVRSTLQTQCNYSNYYRGTIEFSVNHITVYDQVNMTKKYNCNNENLIYRLYTKTAYLNAMDARTGAREENEVNNKSGIWGKTILTNDSTAPKKSNNMKSEYDYSFQMFKTLSESCQKSAIDRGFTQPTPLYSESYGRTYTLRAEKEQYYVGPDSQTIVARIGDTANVRPSITADLSSVLFTSVGGTPVGANPQTDPVTLTLLDNNIGLSMTAEQSKKISTTTNKKVELTYDSATTGANHAIKMIIKDKDGKVVRYETLEDVSTNTSGKISFIPGAIDGVGLNLSEGNYTIQLFNEVDNSAIVGTSNRASQPVEITMAVQRELKAGDVKESGTKIDGTDFYNENGVSYAIKNTVENANIGNDFPYIRVGTLDELESTTNVVGFVSSANVVYSNDGIYERKKLEEPYDHTKYPDGYDYSKCLYVQLAKDASGNSGTTTMLPITSVKIDTRAPYFPSGKNGEEKPIKTENVKASTNSNFFASLFSSPPADLEEEFAGEKVKVIPNAKDYGLNMFDVSGALKADAKAIKDGIVSYEMIASPLDMNGNVIDSKVIKKTINVLDDKFKDPDNVGSYVPAYFELSGKDVYWLQISAKDQAGRTTMVEEKLILDATVPGKPTIAATYLDEDNNIIKYPGGAIEDVNGKLVDNWVGQDFEIELALSDKDKEELKSGVDYYEYTTSSAIKNWVDAGNKKEDLVWTSLGKKTKVDADGNPIFDDKGNEILVVEDIFKSDSTLDVENDTFYFRAVSRAKIKGTESTFLVKKDKIAPKLTVAAFDMDTKLPYVESSYAKKGIKFTLTSDDIDTIPSGVKYYYRGVSKAWQDKNPAKLPDDKTVPWIEVEKNKVNAYEFVVTDEFEGVYYFRGENGAEVSTKDVEIQTTKTKVGVEQPKTPIKVSAVNAKGQTYDGNWTSSTITLSVTGGLDSPNTPAYYEYATSPTATKWTKLEAVDGTFSLAITGDSSVNASYYFRVVKSGDVDEIPYSTQKSGTRIRYDANVPLIKAVSLTPESPNISSTYVTLKVECNEKDTSEASNASPISAYSIDDGTKWISANSKTPKVFSYDFDKNIADIKIKVKDEAGNITAYPTTLTVDNIDKTGPKAPTFANGDEFKGGKWKNTTQNIEITFDKATTGASEQIQYRLQKLENGSYVEYDMNTSTSGGTATWISAPFGTDTHSVRIPEAGNFKIIARTNDFMGRVSAESTTTDIIRIDMTAPTITNIVEVEDKWATTSANFLAMLTGETFFKDHITYTFNGADEVGGSGLEKYQYQLAALDAVAPDDTKWVDAYKGEVNIEEDFVGKLYARSRDYAGNTSTVVEFDGIRVDATMPSLEANPKDLSINWTNGNSVEITAKDAGSGIKDSKVLYTSTYVGTATIPSGELTLDGLGKATLANLPDGDYSLSFTTEDNSAHSETLEYPVRIDSTKPSVAIIDPDPTTIVSEKELTIEVQDTIGGRKSLLVSLDGREVSGLTISNKLPTVLTGSNITVYTLKVKNNGLYEVEVIGNTLHDGVPVQDKQALSVSNVFSAKPIIKVEAYNGNDMSSDVYESGTWTKEHVEVSLSNTEPTINNSALRYQYRCFDVDNNEITTGWTNIVDSEVSTTTGRFSIYANGKRRYEFRAVMLDPSDETLPPLLASESDFLEVFQDTSIPNEPKLKVNDIKDYTQEIWYASAKTLEVEFVANTDGMGQWIEYNLDGEKSGAALTWRKANFNTTTKNYEIKVSGDKQHVVKIRSNDEFDRYSVETIAYVNIDTSTPTFDVDMKFSNSSGTLTLVTTDKNGKPTIGVSGLYKATIQKKLNGVLVPDTEKFFYGNKVVITKDEYGNGTYEITLETNSGKVVKKDIVVNGINLPKAILSVQGVGIGADTSETPYVSGTWSDAERVKLKISPTNLATTGALIYEYKEDGDNDWTRTANDGVDDTFSVTGNGRHLMSIRAINASGITSEVVNYDVLLDNTWDNSFTIQQDTLYPTSDTPWYNQTQIITTTFTKDTDGCKEWIEYSEDGTTWSHNSRNTYEVATTGKHELHVRKNNEIGSGNRETGQQINVFVDKEPVRNFKVSVDRDSFSSFLSTITFGIYHNETKEAVISGDFGQSEMGDSYIQIVDQPSDYVNVYASTADDAGWQPYTAPVNLDNNFKGFIYAKAKDKAGNTSNIIRSDGIVVDTVAPTITIDDLGGNWIVGNDVQVSVSDVSDTITSVVGNASGITSISYETSEPTPVTGTLGIDENKAIIRNLNDGSYTLSVNGIDKAGNTSVDTKTLKLDRITPTLRIEGYDELSFTAVNNLVLTPNVGVSGIQKVSVKGECVDGTSIAETHLTGPLYAYAITKNGTYTFTVENGAGVSAETLLEVANITTSMDDIMGLDIKTRDGKGDIIDYLHAEELPGENANPSWTSSDVVFTARGNAKFKAAIDAGRFVDFQADGTFVVSGEGEHIVKVRNDKNASERTFLVKIDKYEVKNVEIKDASKYPDGKWFNDKQTISASYLQDDTGIDEWIEAYDANQGTWVKKDSVVLDYEGEHTVRFRGNDELNRPTAEQRVNVFIDKTAPTDLQIKVEKQVGKEWINHYFPNTFDEIVDVSIHSNSDISGNKKIEYQVINEEAGESFNDMIGWKTYTNSFSIADGFKGKVYARASDNAGNKSLTIVSEDGIVVDSQTPTIVFQTSPMTTWQKDNEVKATITTTISGLQEAYYTVSQYGIVNTYTIDLKDIDASGNVTLKNLPNGQYVIDVYAKNKAGKTGTAKLDKVMFENRGALLKVNADLINKAVSVPVEVEVDMSGLHTTLASLTWQSGTTSAQDITASKKFTVNNNGNYKIVATTTSGVTSEKIITVSNISNVSSVLGINAYYSKDATKPYLGGDTWSDQDISVEIRDISGKVPSGDLSIEVQVYNVNDGSIAKPWTIVDADKSNADIFKMVATDEGAYAYEFRGNYQGVIGTSTLFQVNIDRSAPKKPNFSETTLTTYNNDAWHSSYDALVEVSTNPTQGCGEWLEYNLDNATDFDGNPLWVATKNPVSDSIKVVDDKDHTVKIRVSDALGRVSDVNEIHVKLDSTRPTDFYIKAGVNKYQDFLDMITGGIFYKDSTTIEIGGNFVIAGVETIEYQYVKTGDTFDKANPWKRITVGVGEEHGDFQLLPGSMGVIYARGVDKAGNETGIIRSDLITIDNSAPLLRVPEDASVWSDQTTMKIEVKDDESGIQAVTYKSDYPLQSGDVVLSDTINADGYREGFIYNLKDGQYLVSVEAKNKAGDTQTKLPRVMIDTITPSLKVEGQTSIPLAKVTLDLLPIVGGSGLQEIQELDKEGNIIDTILPNVDGSDRYPRDFISNGDYFFRVVSNAGKQSDIVKVVIGNIKADKPQIIFRSDNGYDPLTWSGKKVVLETNTNTNAKLSYRKKGESDYIDADHGYYQDLTFDKTGIYTYEFKAVYEGVGGAEDKVTLDEYTVKVDLQAPKKPSVKDRNDFEQWYKTSKDVTLLRDTSDYVDGTKYGDGSKEQVFYHIDGDNDALGNPNWIATDVDTITINRIGDNIVTFKIIDEVAEHVSYSDPIHVKIYADDPSIILTDSTKPVKSFELGIEIAGAIQGDDQVKTLQVERVGGAVTSIPAQQDVRMYNFPIAKNGTYIVRVEMEFGGQAQAELVVSNIIEEDSILNISATYDNAGAWENYTFGKWVAGDVKLQATEAKITPNLSIEVREKAGLTWGAWTAYTAGNDIVINTTGNHIYQFKTILHVGADTYETIMDETFSVKVDKQAPAEVIINEYESYKDENSWSNKAVNLTTTFTSDPVGAKEWVEYSLDDGITWIKRSSVLVSNVGKNKVLFRASDETGRSTTSTKNIVYVNIDTSSAGSVSMQVGRDPSSSNNPNNITFNRFYQPTDTVSLTMYKNATDVDLDGTIFYQFADNHNGYVNSDAAWKVYSTPFTLPDNFKGSIYAYGKNVSGKKTSIIRSDGITVDSVAPVIVKPSGDMSTWSKSNLYPVEISETLSGLDETQLKYAIYASADAIAPSIAEQSFSLIDGKGNITLPEGENYIEIKASDKAGNATTPVRYKVMIDARDTSFTLSQVNAGDHATITTNITDVPASGIEGVYIRSEGSSWYKMGNTSPATFDAYRNGIYEVKVINGAGKASAIKNIEVTSVVNDIPDFALETTDGFNFGDYWYQPLTIRVMSNADEIYYSTNGASGPWNRYDEKIYINETSATQFTFKVKTEAAEYISLPYDARVVITQADVPSSYRMEEKGRSSFVADVFSSFANKKVEQWWNIGRRITFPLSPSTAPGLLAGTFVQVLQADQDGNGIGYNDRNFTLVDKDNPTYTFNNEGKYVVYTFYAYYVDGEEDNWSRPAEISKNEYNIDGTSPEDLKLKAEIDGTTTILSNLTGGLFFKEPITIKPEARDALSGIDHFEFQQVACEGASCDGIGANNGDWNEASELIIPQNFEGIVFVRAVDASQPTANVLEKAVKLAIKDDITTYKILDDVSSWTNLQYLSVEVSPSTTGLQSMQYSLYESDPADTTTPVEMSAVDVDQQRYQISDLPEGNYFLNITPIENGGLEVNSSAHELKIDRTAPKVRMEIKESNRDTFARIINAISFNNFYKPGIEIKATASDQAGALEMDAATITIEYLHDGEWKSYDKALFFDQDEVIHLAFRAIDQAGNCSDIVTSDAITIDGSAPIISGATNNQSYWLPRRIQVRDEGSGIATISINEKLTTTASSYLFQTTGVVKLTAQDKLENESSLAFTIKGLANIKDEDITEDLIEEIEQEFEQQKPDYDDLLAKDIQEQIDDLKNRKPNQQPGETPEDPNKPSEIPDNPNKPGEDIENPGNSNNKPNGNTGTGSGSNNTDTGIKDILTSTNGNNVSTGDSTGVIAFILLGTVSGCLIIVLRFKQKLKQR